MAELDARQSTGVDGLDQVLGGGLPANRLYLLRGSPGAGKTTLALQFLLEGVRQGECVLYITLSETEEEIRQVVASHHWSLDGVNLFELSSVEQTLRLDEENTLFATEDVELRETLRVLLEEVDRLKPARVVFDSLSEVRLLARTPARYRRQILALKQHFVGRRCTVLLLDDGTTDGHDEQVESIAHGVIDLDHLPMGYGADRRRMRVAKLRGSTFRSGYHDFALQTGGLAVYPRLVSLEHRTQALAAPISSGNPGVDRLLGGGVDTATSTLFVGPAGTGKSALATLFARSAALSGTPASLFLFEERIGTLRRRAEQLGMPIDAAIEEGSLRPCQIDPAELAPDQFSQLVRDEVEEHGARVVVVDSINGYFTAMPEARHLLLQMHELLSFLAEKRVATILTMAQAGVVGSQMTSPIDVSYLADSIVLLRYFEARGRLRKAISVLKKRSSSHLDTIHDLEMGPHGFTVGKPLTGLRGVLSGVPLGGPDSGEASNRDGC